MGFASAYARRALGVGAGAGVAAYGLQLAYHVNNKRQPVALFDRWQGVRRSALVAVTTTLVLGPRLLTRTLPRVYARMLESAPAATGIGTTGVSYTIGEFVAQSIDIKRGKRQHYDLRRMATITVYGFVLAGPIYYKFFSGIDHVPYLLWQMKNRLHAKEISRLAEFARSKGLQFTSEELAANPLSPVTKIASKIFVDQVLFSAPYTAFFLFASSVMLGKTVDDAWLEVKKKFIHIYLYDCAFWPPGQLLNYGLVPSHMRQAVFSVLNLTWNTILCLLSAGH